MNGDDVNVPPQRTDQQVRDDRDGHRDPHDHPHDDPRDTGDGIHRDPYGRNDDVLVASDLRDGRDTGPHQVPGHHPDPAHDVSSDEAADRDRAHDPLDDSMHDPMHDPSHDRRHDPDLQQDRDGLPNDLPNDTVMVTEVTSDGPGPAQPAGEHAAPRPFDLSDLFDADPAEVQSRWRDVQASFVDDPAEAVQRADGLVGEVVESLTNTLRSRTEELREHWKSDGGDDTERLRQSLREYRGVLEGLLALSGRGEAPGSTTVK